MSRERADDSLAEFKQRLDELRLSVGNPSDGWFRRHDVPRSTLYTTLTGPAKPRWVTVELFLSACEKFARSDEGRWPAAALERFTWQRRWSALSAAPGPHRPEDDPPVAGRRWIGVIPKLASRYQGRGLDVAAGRQHVLTGLNGVGKTQAAAELARSLWKSHEIDELIWVRAGSRDEVVRAYANAWAEIDGQPEDDDEQAANRLLTWLEITPRRWLVVLDDLNDPADMRTLWPPSTPSGRAVVTTNRRDASLAADGRDVVAFAPFSDDEALRYVHEKLADRPDLTDGAETLVATLDRLPLALSQAIAYLLDTELTCTEYLSRLARRGLHGVPLPALPDDQAAPAGATWALSLRRADALPPAGLATPVLRVLALLDPGGVPETVLGAASLTGVLESERRAADPDDARDALRCLRRLSLVDIEAGLVRVHVLVQRATRETIPPGELTALRRAVADALVEIWPEVDREQVRRLLANADALLAGGIRDLCDEGVHPLVFRAGRSMGESGGLEAAADHFARARRDTGGVLALDHADALRLRHLEMYWLGQAGYTENAAELAEALLPDAERALGPDDGLVRDTLIYQARWLGARDPEAAVDRLSRLRESLLEKLGPEHRDTLTVRNDLAQFSGLAGHLERAVEEFRLVAEDRARVLGPLDQHTLISRNGYGFWLGKAGRLGEAAAVLAEVTEACRATLGPDHMFTLGSRGSLITFRAAMDGTASHLAELHQLCGEMRAHLGPRNPMTLHFGRVLRDWQTGAAD
jgi:hypothetical protein